MRVIGLAGWSGAGKTTLITQVVPLLKRRGVRVATVKHAHHAADIDHPGTDSFRHRAAGATDGAHPLTQFTVRRFGSCPFGQTDLVRPISRIEARFRGVQAPSGSCLLRPGTPHPPPARRS